MLGKNSDEFIRQTYQALYVPIPIQRQHALVDKNARGIVRTNKIRDLDEQKATIVHDRATNMSLKHGVARIQEVTTTEYDMLRTVNASKNKFGIIAPPVLRRSVPVERLGRVELKEMAKAESKLHTLNDRVADGFTESAVLTTEADYADVEERLMRKGNVDEDLDMAYKSAVTQIINIKDPLAKSRELVRAALKVPVKMPLVKPSAGGAAHQVGNVGRSAQQRSGMQPEQLGPSPLPPTVAPPSGPFPQKPKAAMAPATPTTPEIAEPFNAPYAEPSTPVKAEPGTKLGGKMPLKPKRLFNDAGAGSSTDPAPSPGLPQPAPNDVPAASLPFIFPRPSNPDFGGVHTQSPAHMKQTYDFIKWQNAAASPYLNPGVGTSTGDTPFSFSEKSSRRDLHRKPATDAHERDVMGRRDASLRKGRATFKAKTHNTRGARLAFDLQYNTDW